MSGMPHEIRAPFPMPPSRRREGRGPLPQLCLLALAVALVATAFPSQAAAQHGDWRPARVREKEKVGLRSHRRDAPHERRVLSSTLSGRLQDRSVRLGKFRKEQQSGFAM